MKVYGKLNKFSYVFSLYLMRPPQAFFICKSKNLGLYLGK